MDETNQPCLICCCCFFSVRDVLLQNPCRARVRQYCIQFVYINIMFFKANIVFFGEVLTLC